MEYIRTNKGRIVNINATQLELYEEAVKVADTIEELCDEFVVEGKSYHIVLDKMGYETIKRYEKDEDINIYGAIWTGKGLIYVAKVKESVEWKLLCEQK